jgi:putative transposase
MHRPNEIRNSIMQLNQVYFWTDTVKDWKHLLKQDKYKQTIIESWKDLSQKKLINIYGFVIMPNHLHVIWELLALNGKEMPHASFNKQTSHLILKDLKLKHIQVLPYFKVDEKEREYRVWQRDPLAILMDYKNKLEQKLNYLHYNPLHERWNLAERPELYFWSSAKFYETGIDDFGFLTHYMERFG